jgi:hypothetical protein
MQLGEREGHRVTTGWFSIARMHGMREDAKAEAKEHGVDKHSTEHGHMTVTNLSMVNDSLRNKGLPRECPEVDR